ncbi:MAG: acyl-CoA dehydrogenase family protein [Alphaproteobacteria bacterium]|jgi:pimeloyl-CoA dehydrogenase small subunit|nr:acyl-CoA dehydrogenase family protein [Alphaproteobacteria bacterium]MDP6813958.1 acyl-CoA dehydrogenase family protein [Alphaproteobacteria bacterium]
MDFSLSEEQQLLKDSVQRFVREEYELESRRKLVASDAGYSEEHWAMMAELGWLAVALPEEYGGIGGGPVETMVLMEEFGRGLVVEPYLASIVLGGNFLMAGGGNELKTELLPKLAAGELKLAFGYAERQSRFDLNDVETKAEKNGGGYVLNGQKGVVYHAACADKIIVSARTSGGSREAGGITLFLVDNNADGLSRRDYPTVDGLRASELELSGVAVGADAVLGEVDNGAALMETVVGHGIASLCAEAVGCMDVLQETTNEYLKTRVQFGVPLSKFQVLQHRMVDMFMECEQARSMCYMVTLKLDDEDPVERAKAVSAAKVQIGNSGRYVGQQSVQLHGGMGMTDELHVGHYFKRLTMIDTMFGNKDHHLKRYADM